MSILGSCRPRAGLWVALTGASLLVAAAASPVLAASPDPTADDLAAARTYCEASGGQVELRRAAWNTNSDPSAWVDLGRTVELCRFVAGDEAGSHIYVDLMTLWSEAPSLAAAAYLARIPMAELLEDELAEGEEGDMPAVGMANPANLYCTALGGSSQFGMGAAGGGWVNTDDPVFTVVAMCVFPDFSMIDEWGIAYYSNGDVRGADLAPLFRSGQEYPPIFPQPET